MFRYPWLAASLAFVVFIFSIEAAVTSPPDLYGPVLRECSLQVQAFAKDNKLHQCNLLDIKPETINSCLCAPGNGLLRTAMNLCVQAGKRSDDIAFWRDFKCSTCRNNKIKGRGGFVPLECPRN